MFPGIPILDHDIHHVKMIHHEAQRAIRRLRRRIPAQTERGEHSGDERGVVRDLVEHRVVRPVAHGVEDHLELDGFGREWLRDRFERDERGVVHVVVEVDRARWSQGRGAVVCD